METGGFSVRVTGRALRYRDAPTVSRIIRDPGVAKSVAANRAPIEQCRVGLGCGLDIGPEDEVVGAAAARCRIGRKASPF